MVDKTRLKRKAKKEIREALERVNQKIVSLLSSKSVYKPLEVSDESELNDVLKSDIANFQNYNLAKETRMLGMYLKLKDSAVDIAMRVLK